MVDVIKFKYGGVIVNFKGKNVIVTGAAKGIGRAIVLGYARLGANVVAIDILEKELEKTVRDASEYNTKIKGICISVSDEEAIRKAVRDSVEEFEQIHVLVNNAGIYPGNNFITQKTEEWKRIIDINILGTMYPTQEILPHMIENGYGRIINLGSVAGEYGLDAFVDYSMTKGAVISFTKALSKLVGDKGITVNCVSPGTINTISENTLLDERTTLKRFGTPDELANAVMFLSIDEASYITGQNLLVDGGRRST